MKSCSWPGGEEGRGGGDKEEEEGEEERGGSDSQLQLQLMQRGKDFHRGEKKKVEGKRETERVKPCRCGPKHKWRNELGWQRESLRKKIGVKDKAILGEFPVCLNMT